MAAFPRILLTNAGKNMIAMAQLGQQLIFTKAQYGDGILTEDENQEVFTKLKQAKLDLPIQSMKNPGNGQIEVTVLVDRTDLMQGFFGREIGLFAKIGETGIEQLFCYTNAGNLADYIPSKDDDDTPYHEFIDIEAIVGNSQNLTVIMDDTKIYVTKEIFDTHEKVNRIWAPEETVAKGDIRYPRSIDSASYIKLECTAGGTTGKKEPVWGGLGTLTSDGGTATWMICDKRNTTGAIAPFRQIALGKDGLISSNLLENIATVEMSGGHVVRKYSDGWMEMYGIFAQTSQTQTFTLPIAFAHIPFNFAQVTDIGKVEKDAQIFNCLGMTTTTIKVTSNTFTQGSFMYYARGYWK